MQDVIDADPLLDRLSTEVRQGKIFSGLTRDTVAGNEAGVPYLSDIPGLGWAFKTKASSIKREEIYIFVTPTILKEKPISPPPAVAMIRPSDAAETDKIGSLTQ